MQNTFLTLNTEMHTTRIKRIDSDAQGKYILTCSADKTAKLWEANTGELIRTFRPPMGTGNEGMLYAGAIAPDGKQVAVGGWSKSRNDDIYIFETQTGMLLQRISGLPNVILDLAYSPNGRYLAATLGRGEGIRIYRTKNYQAVFKDANYGGNSYKVAFAPTGQLATVCYDGYIRLYNSDFSLLQKVKTTGGTRPISLAFAPNGQYVAVGFDDSARLQVLDAKTLKLLFEPNIKGASDLNERLDKVAFSKDSQVLIAGGFYSLYKEGKWWRQIRVWEESGRGAYQDISAADNTIIDIKVLPNGHVLYGGSSPDWGIIDPLSGKRLLYKAAELNSYRLKDQSHFKISRTGLEIGVTPSGKSPLTFDVEYRSLEKIASTMPSYKAELGQLKVSDWKNTYQPKLNGRLLTFLKQYEMCRSIDLANDEESMVFGADFGIYKLNAKGKEQWNTRTQSTAWAVNISGNGQVVTTVLGNGQIRWYRMSDGVLLLSLFIHADLEHWVLWTPSGYYDASPGAEDLIGWHVNQGEDKEALYYPISRFREQYYRPDVIDLILWELDEAKALTKANENSNKKSVPRLIEAMLPPTVSILTPSSGTSINNKTVNLTYRCQSPNKEPITRVRVLVDGRPVDIQKRGLKIAAEFEKTVSVEIPTDDCVVAVIAENKHGASQEASVALKWAGRIITPSELMKPTLYVLAIGVGAYEKVEQLTYPAKDAQDFVKTLYQQQGQLYKEVNVQLLIDEKATKDNILDGLDWIQQETTSRDLAMLFFAGHGVDNNAGTFYFLPQNADLNRLKRTGVMNEDIKQTIATIAGKVVVFMDACHSGALMKETRRGGAPDINLLLNEFSAAETGAIMFSSSTGRQYSLESDRWNNGAFTKALVEGLNGKADILQSGKITCKSLDVYLVERVKALTERKQAPVTTYPPDTQDFPIALVV